MKTNYISILLIIVSLLCSSCSDNESEPVEVLTNATFTIKSRAADDNNASDRELINSWWIAFVDNDGNVSKILQRSSDRNNAVERETFSLKIASGTYTVYAFANIERGTYGLNFTEGQPAPVLTAIKWSEIGSVGDLVPMTGVLYDKVLDENTAFDIEVVRLWAKMCFKFTTDASNEVKIKKISITPALNGEINILPDYRSLGNAPVLPEGTSCTTLDRTTDISVTKDAGASETFYLLESTATNHPTGRYPISFDLQYGDGFTRTVSALAYNLSYINRNDFITIPVLITDWLVDIDVHFYPPIGGYPAVITDQRDGEFYAIFGSSGFFELSTRVSNGNTGELLANDRFSAKIVLESGAELFSQMPTLKNDEIVGEIAENKTGTAVINLEITIIEDVLQHTFTRKLYITKN